MTNYHENLLRDSPLSLHTMVKFISSLETKKVLKLPNETFLKITRYYIRRKWFASKVLTEATPSLTRLLNGKLHGLIHRRTRISWGKPTFSIEMLRNLMPLNPKMAERTKEEKGKGEKATLCHAWEIWICEKQTAFVVDVATWRRGVTTWPLCLSRSPPKRWRNEKNIRHIWVPPPPLTTVLTEPHYNYLPGFL